MKARAAVAVCLSIFISSGALAQDGAAKVAQPLSLEETLEKPVVGAAKYEQRPAQAPASISVVTAEDIELHGYRTLADILASLRDVYITDDRNYQYFGARGLGIPGDINSRVLLLVDGHRLNDTIFDTAAIGLDSAIDVEIIERVEFIRGPSSSLYGSNALFGVINVITKYGMDQDGVKGRVETGVRASPAQYDSTRAWVSGGHMFDNGLDVYLAASGASRSGAKTLYFPEFNGVNGSDGVARNQDGERYGSFYGKVSWLDLKLSGGFQGRRKDVPTASYGSVFGDAREYTYDGHAFADLAYTRRFSRTQVSARAFYDRYVYAGDFPADTAVAPAPPLAVLNRDESEGQAVGAELQATRTWIERRGPVSHVNTIAGTEVQDRFRLMQRNFEPETGNVNFDRNDASRVLGVYATGEATLWDRIVLNAGLRYDHWFGYHHSLNPRCALILEPVDRTVIKLLYGSAFRAANAYERFYGGPDFQINPGVRPETLRSGEVVLEQYLGEHVRALANAYWYRMNDMIAFTQIGGLYTYDNLNAVDARGVGVELEAKWASGLRGRVSYLLQKATVSQASAAEADLPNSPHHLAKLTMIVPVWRQMVFAALEARYLSQRQTVQSLGGTASPMDGYFLADLAITVKPTKRLTLTAIARNLTNQKYLDPASDEHVQNGIPQDGFTAWLRATFSM